MALPGVYDLHLYRGDSYSWRFHLWQDTEQSIPVDLTDATAAAEIREKSAGAMITELGVAVTVPNTIDVTLGAAQWSAIPAAGVWDLQVTFTDGRVRTAVGGKVTTAPDVTDSLPTPSSRVPA